LSWSSKARAWTACFVRPQTSFSVSHQDSFVKPAAYGPRGASDRAKTDRRDAERLVRLLVAGELRGVAVPSVEEEALRDLVRAREDLRGDLMRARHRLAKLLLRHEVRFDGPQANWTQAHLGWLAGVELQQPGSQRALEDYAAR
jgi:transposase